MAHFPIVSVIIAVNGGPAHNTIIKVEIEVALGRCGRLGSIVAQSIDADEVGAFIHIAKEANRAIAFPNKGTTRTGSRTPARGDGKVEDVVGIQGIGLDIIIEHMGREAFNSKQIDVGNTFLVGEISSAVH